MSVVVRRASRDVDRRWPAPITVAVLAVGAFAAPLGMDAQSARPVEIAVVVHPSAPLASLSLANLRRIFLGEQQFWGDHTRITLLIHAPGTPERDAALRLVYQMNEADFRRYWIAKIFRAEVAVGPKIVYSTGMARLLVATVPGAIALLPANQVDASMRVLPIDGRRPGEDGYPLR